MCRVRRNNESNLDMCSRSNIEIHDLSLEPCPHAYMPYSKYFVDASYFDVRKLFCSIFLDSVLSNPSVGVPHFVSMLTAFIDSVWVWFLHYPGYYVLNRRTSDLILFLSIVSMVDFYITTPYHPRICRYYTSIFNHVWDIMCFYRSTVPNRVTWQVNVH